MSFFSISYVPFIAIIGDIKDSKQMKDRGDFQNKLNEVLDYVNKSYSSSIASKFTITLGDEFQGLLVSGSDVVEIIQYMKKEFYPVRVRFGIGVGSISTKINPEISIGADGPCYYKARESIEYLKKLESKKEKTLSDIHIRIDGDNDLSTLSLNTIFNLMYSIENKWTQKQREIINYVMFEKVSQIEVSKHFHVSQPNIQQILSKSHYYAFKEAMVSCCKILKEIKNYEKL